MHFKPSRNRGDTYLFDTYVSSNCSLTALMYRGDEIVKKVRFHEGVTHIIVPVCFVIRKTTVCLSTVTVSNLKISQAYGKNRRK